jgi:Predicted membrane protein
MSLSKAFVAVLLMALVTYIPRVLPISIFRRKIKSRYIKSFLNYVPYAVLGSLTFPDIFYSTGNLITAVCGTVIALILAYFEKSLVVVAIGAIITVYLTSFLL